MRRILIADDDPDCQELLRQVFEGVYTLRLVDDGAQALEVAREWLPDVLVIDVCMPGLSGVEVTRALRGDPRTSSILVAAYTGSVDMTQAELQLFDVFLLKPTRPREVRRVVEALVRR